MLVDCFECKARVDGKVIGTVERFVEVTPDSYSLSLLRCPVCHSPIAAYQDWNGEEQDGWNGDTKTIWGAARRVWPSPELSLASVIPKPIRHSLLEARKCLLIGAYTASVAMTGRALEAIGRHFHTKGKASKLMLAEGIKELYESKVIDERLYEWSRELHLNRNLAAHASEQEFKHDDAEDLLNFAMAICDYVFVLSDKFSRFKERSAAAKAKETPLLAEPAE